MFMVNSFFPMNGSSGQDRSKPSFFGVQPGTQAQDGGVAKGEVDPAKAKTETGSVFVNENETSSQVKANLDSIATIFGSNSLDDLIKSGKVTEDQFEKNAGSLSNKEVEFLHQEFEKSNKAIADNKPEETKTATNDNNVGGTVTLTQTKQEKESQKIQELKNQSDEYQAKQQPIITKKTQDFADNFDKTFKDNIGKYVTPGKICSPDSAKKALTDCGIPEDKAQKVYDIILKDTNLLKALKNDGLKKRATDSNNPNGYLYPEDNKNLQWINLTDDSKKAINDIINS